MSIILNVDIVTKNMKSLNTSSQKPSNYYFFAIWIPVCLRYFVDPIALEKIMKQSIPIQN